LLTVWHNKAPGQLLDQEKQILFHQLSMKAPRLSPFFEEIKAWDHSQGFYALGAGSQDPWPVKISRACYADPLVARSLLLTLENSGIAEIDVVRYRSVEDFLILLDQAERQTPGILKPLNLKLYGIIPEPPVTLSFRLIFSIIVGVSGLVVVSFFNKA
ncbi:MAG: hypothetical protein K9M55_03440, partial [Candidatus Marinimicrobia bacterium]|nr:hypothetical protein [Candidatus Neomarinimicrobiota bacterium]